MKRQKLDEEEEDSLILKCLYTSLLATVLGTHGWRSASRLLRVCKRFHEAVQRQEFWMPRVKERLIAYCSPRTIHIDILPYVNPFFRFPPHVYMCPPWPWWRFLAWLFPSSPHGSGSRVSFTSSRGLPRISIFYHNQDVLVFQALDGIHGRSTFWYMDGNLSGGVPAICCTKYERASHSGYHVTVNNSFVWYDGRVGGRHWCGAVRDEPVIDPEHDNMGNAVPIEGLGFYKE
jgi:hypothetical protein